MLDVEALPGHDAAVLRQRRTATSAAAVREAFRLELFGRRPRIRTPGATIKLSGRHAEILAALLLAGRGLTAEELALEVYGETGKPVTLRAEMSRLRRDLGGLLLARPYAFAVPVTSDLQDAEKLLGSGRLADALALCAQRLMPWSEAPLVIEARERLEHGLRQAVLAAGDARLLDVWCRSAAGQEDAPAADALLRLLRSGDARVPAARARLARLQRVFGP
jgi:hypothetical protein